MRLLLLAALAALVLFQPSTAFADRAARAVKKNDRDGDGRVSRDEWRKGGQLFKKIDGDGDGYLTVDEFRARFEGRSAGGAGGGPKMMDGQVPLDTIDAETVCALGRGRDCDIKLAVKYGMFETGLRPRFPDGLDCRDIDEQWAIDYTWKRDRENYHGGIDMPAPFGTPMIAAADGTVITKVTNEKSYRGLEIIVRHSPEDTGLPYWLYTQYAHFDKPPAVEVGDRVLMGQVLGPTGNSGKAGSRGGGGPGSPFGRNERRPAIHFAVWFSESPNYAVYGIKVIPVGGLWMDPNALWRGQGPYDSTSLKALPEDEKKVPIAVMVDDGEVVPAGARIVWPYTCSRE